MDSTRKEFLEENKKEIDKLEKISVLALAEMLKILEVPEIIPKEAFKKDPEEDLLTEEEKMRRHRLKEADCLVAVFRHLYENPPTS